MNDTKSQDSSAQIYSYNRLTAILQARDLGQFAGTGFHKKLRVNESKRFDIKHFLQPNLNS
jgi:hypothetical protein